MGERERGREGERERGREGERERGREGEREREGNLTVRQNLFKYLSNTKMEIPIFLRLSSC